jgi:hypothetical protein
MKVKFLSTGLNMGLRIDEMNKSEKPTLRYKENRRRNEYKAFKRFTGVQNLEHYHICIRHLKGTLNYSTKRNIKCCLGGDQVRISLL